MAGAQSKCSLRGQMTFIILLCWLLPMALAALLGSYLAFGLGPELALFFEDLSLLTWASAVSVELGKGTACGRRAASEMSH